MNDTQKDGLSHIDAHGDAAMVDVGGKPVQRRKAVASGRIHLAAQTISLIQENGLPKGDVLSVARIAGIQAAKRASDLIPLCHPLGLNHIQIDWVCSDETLDVVATVECDARTGAEMEALTGVSVALLTVYDMCKAVDKEMIIGSIRLVEKCKGEP